MATGSTRRTAPLHGANSGQWRPAPQERILPSLSALYPSARAVRWASTRTTLRAASGLKGLICDETRELRQSSIYLPTYRFVMNASGAGPFLHGYVFSMRVMARVGGSRFLSPKNQNPRYGMPDANGFCNLSETKCDFPRIWKHTIYKCSRRFSTTSIIWFVF